MQSSYWNDVFNSTWNPFYDGNIITDGEFADFQEIEDIYNVLMALFCVICAGIIKYIIFSIIYTAIILSVHLYMYISRISIWINNGFIIIR